MEEACRVVAQQVAQEREDGFLAFHFSAVDGGLDGDNQTSGAVGAFAVVGEPVSGEHHRDRVSAGAASEHRASHRGAGSDGLS